MRVISLFKYFYGFLEQEMLDTAESKIHLFLIIEVRYKKYEKLVQIQQYNVDWAQAERVVQYTYCG